LQGHGDFRGGGQREQGAALPEAGHTSFEHRIGRLIGRLIGRRGRQGGAGGDGLEYGLFNQRLVNHIGGDTGPGNPFKRRDGDTACQRYQRGAPGICLSGDFTQCAE